MCAHRRLRSAWAKSTLSAWRKLGSLATHWAHSEDSHQTGQMSRLIWVFAGHTVILLVLSWGSSYRHFSSDVCNSGTEDIMKFLCSGKFYLNLYHLYRFFFLHTLSLTITFKLIRIFKWLWGSNWSLVMPYSYPEWQNFQFAQNNRYGFFFLHTHPSSKMMSKLQNRHPDVMHESCLTPPV